MCLYIHIYIHTQYIYSYRWLSFSNQSCVQKAPTGFGVCVYVCVCICVYAYVCICAHTHSVCVVKRDMYVCIIFKFRRDFNSFSSDFNLFLYVAVISCLFLLDYYCFLLFYRECKNWKYKRFLFLGFPPKYS
jgi:hypothetical protein